ncbi:regulator of microtubule dynamics protein 1 [Lingula anatina]|uniref:Regulator of microtubule dynamics protein 1 n=1 Tax=Lingula anatina TaxID=7574 RepID=A0A1S3J4M7_LINAN|nr:regulator of microtubule dynamics protein 1 [Lingula anatina]|eukprot:XP_013404794.1 regulator of microtubule dynamics protein 1 [Lingula anatina]
MFRRKLRLLQSIWTFCRRNQQSRQQIRKIFTKQFLPSASRWLLLPGAVVSMRGFTFGMRPSEKEPEATSASKSPEEKIIEQADELFDKSDTLALYDYLIQYKDSSNDELLWRLARAATDKGKLLKDPAKKDYYYEAFKYAKMALEKNPNNFACHKWYAILLDYTGEYEGTKQRIANAYEVKEHFLKAVELNPKDATSVHSLGYWCFLFADLPWYQQKIASVIFTTPPTSTYEEALKFFLEAERIDPGFYSMNTMMLGKTYVRLKENARAIYHLKKVKSFPVKTVDDEKAHKEAAELLRGLGVHDHD